MPGTIPDRINLFRIIHKNNLEHALTHGLYIATSIHADPNYINIGDSQLIKQREIYPVGINPPGGNLGEYIPFYFGPLSPMLLNIQTGYRGIIKRPPSDVIYLICNLDQITANCPEWCFTNGHAKDQLTQFYNDINALNQIYWDVVFQRYWNPIENFLDRQVRKQAEFLVKNHVPTSCIWAIVVYDDQSYTLAKEITERLNMKISIYKKPQFYF